MSRLIDADVFAESLIYCKELGRKSMEAVLKSLNEQPTAYDVEEIAKQVHHIILEELNIVLKTIPEGAEYTEEAYRLLYIDTKIRDAININRKGGIDEIPMDESYK